MSAFIRRRNPGRFRCGVREVWPLVHGEVYVSKVSKLSVQVNNGHVFHQLSGLCRADPIPILESDEHEMLE